MITPRLRHNLAARSHGGSRTSGIPLLGCVTLALAAALFGTTQPASAEIPIECQLTASLDFQKIPDDVCPITPASDPLKSFDALAWQTFKMLVWPASPTGRGNADSSKAIAESGRPTFETYKADWETFLPDAAEPTAWDSYAIRSNPCANAPPIQAGDLVLASRSEFGNVVESNPGKVTSLLVAQNRTLVRYLAAYGSLEFNKIVANRLYDPKVLTATPGYQPPGHNPPNTLWAVPDATAAPAGAMTVKSAWVELPEREGSASDTWINPAHFYTRDAWVQNPVTRACRNARVGLVGLHFVHKTPSRPQWLWTTFEHVDNVPEPGDSPGRSYTFNNGKADAMPATPPAEYIIPGPASGSSTPPPPFNVQRLQSIESKTMQMNQAWQDALRQVGSVWQYYKLVLTQWPLIAGSPMSDGFRSRPVPPCANSPNGATANTILETFLQQPTQCPANSVKTCMGCHNLARSSDFVWSIPVNENTPQSTTGKTTPRHEALRRLGEIARGAVR